MLALGDVPEGVVLPPIDELVIGRPLLHSQRRLEWLCAESAQSVFLSCFELGDSPSDRVFLFGARHDLARLRNAEPGVAAGYFIEFIIVREASLDGWIVHRLTQRYSTNYSEADDEKDYVPAGSIKSPAAMSVGEPPKWKKHAAYWPTSNGAPMDFVGQVGLPETPVTRQFLTWNANAYLFKSRSSLGEIFKVQMQQAKFQSAQDHYRQEARRLSRDRRPS